MRLLPMIAACLLLLPASMLRGAEPHPLRLVPEQANLVVRVENPRLLAETITGIDLVRQLQQLPFVRGQLESPVFQRFLQLVAHFEKSLGSKWPDLLDKLAGRGLTLAVKAGDDNAPVLLVIDGTDAALSARFVDLGITLLEQELARQESRDKVERPEYRGISGFKVGELQLARIGATILVSNKVEALRRSIDLHLDGGKSLATSAGPNDARKVLPEKCLAWLWLDLDVLRRAPGAKDAFAQPSNDVVSTVAVGGWIDVVRRARFLAAAVHQEGDTLGLTLRFPGGGHEGQPPQMLVHSPPKGAAGTLPPLEPKFVIFSHSFWYDFNALWEQRDKLFNEKIAKDFANGEKQIRPFLPNTSLAKLFAQSGPAHRFVVAHQEKVGYAVKPKQYLPHFAIVTSMRDPEFAHSIEAVLRAVVLLAGGQFKMKLADEMHDGVKIVGYRFAEDAVVPGDPENLRFNFSPCIAAVGDQFALCSTFEFGREIVELLKQEARDGRRVSSGLSLQSRLYGRGAIGLLKAYEDQILGQIVLDQAVKPQEGQKQLEAIADWLGRVGQLEFHSGYRDKEYRFDIEWRRTAAAAAPQR
jgi:hypothetical protein